MASVTFALNDELKLRMSRFPWVNWSEVGRESFVARLRRAEALKKLSELTRKSKLTEEDALKLAKELKESMWGSYNKEL